MEAPPAGAVVLTSFPFSDVSRSTRRPAVVLARESRGDCVLCQVTSNPYADPTAVEPAEAGFPEGSLQRVRCARPGKRFTANADVLEGQVGLSSEEVRSEIVSEVIDLLRAGEMPFEGE
jgi:mRNA interferase MazF